jgi:hypothetical protein
MHPQIIALLAEDKRRQFPCGAVAEHAHGLCRKCQARIAWRRRAGRSRRRAAYRLASSDGTRLRVAALFRLRTYSNGNEEVEN